MEQSTVLYVDGGFSYHEAVNTEHPLLVYRKAHNALCWLQAGNRLSPGHVDHGRVLSYIPPGLQQTFKIWVAFKSFNAAKEFSFGCDAKDFDRMLAHEDTVVVVQRPGDVVYIGPLIYHSVLLGYTKGTSPDQRWGLIDGYVFIS
ncbi:hypothetical protein PHYSODRAFT_531175 [Phytophthora sojae]|uniref:JmjC domain-containing protein n=1 Tax=Phytophthora sojae (strain P6497) TaxID=1094619 RepID=G5ADC9_PHYSP|nr:hypothetical protein PHYSODRAFT_531175 [Phytophthora sojae]EGZ06182.1 hypothetical protein PHYSODRAFT_531175 [Phytophthora sojae]|eukprot:XP_009538079.1 hypothetical protein PHYSODRAFT_531175 [Phytophthora sojae]